MKGSFALITGMHWGAVLFYVAATITMLTGVFFGKEQWERYGNLVVVPGVIIHAVALVLWSKIAGHGPFIDQFEVLSAYAWWLAAGFLVFTRFYPRIRQVGVVVYPVTFIMVAISLFIQPQIKELPPSFRGIWLVLHVIFYNISFTSLVIALAFSLFFLLKRRNRLQRFTSLPDLPVMDNYAYRFAGFGFVFWAIGMATGSIWAYNSWNIFWNWDPVQTWSLIAWALFGLYLHLRRFFGWQGEKAAWLFILCFTTVLVSLFLTPVIESSIHAGYFK